MDFKLTTRRVDSVLILDLAGKVTAGDALTLLRQTIRDEVAKGHTRILLNLKDVSYIDSSGLGELIMALGTVTQTICASSGATDISACSCRPSRTSSTPSTSWRRWRRQWRPAARR